MPKRTALPLPRYTLRKPLRAGGWGYFFNPPTWARKAGCPVRNEPLGTDYAAAVQRAETVLLAAFDSWRTDGHSDAVRPVAASGTLDWVFSEYRADRRFTKLDERTRHLHEGGFRLVGGYLLKDGRRLGEVRLGAIDSAVVDRLYDTLLTVTYANGVQRERRTRVNHAMKSCFDGLGLQPFSLCATSHLT